MRRLGKVKIMAGGKDTTAVVFSTLLKKRTESQRVKDANIALLMKAGGMNAVKARELLSHTIRLKGEGPGHPFRGNQWTDGYSTNDPIITSHIEGFDEKRFLRVFGDPPKMQPEEIIRAFVGETFNPRYFEVQSIADSWRIEANSGAEIYGKEVYYFARVFDHDPVDGLIVQHDYLKFQENQEEKGIGAKELFAKSLDMYDTLGVSRIDVHAALETGAYTWSKYGFQYGDHNQREAHQEELREQLHRLVPDINALPSEAQADLMMVETMLRDQTLTANQKLSDMPTPDLDAWLKKELDTKPVSRFEEWAYKMIENGLDDSHEKFMNTGVVPYIDKGPVSFMKHLYYGTHWSGNLRTDPSTPGRQRCDTYIAKRPSKKYAEMFI